LLGSVFQVNATVISKSCQSAVIRNEGNGRTATREGWSEGGTFYGRFLTPDSTGGTDTCRYAAAAPFPFNTMAPNCGDIASQGQFQLGLCLTATDFIRAQAPVARR
jgi:hypothetical protein